MVKPLQRAEMKSFSGGLVTDAPRMQYPENASRSEANFDCNIDGSRSRRLGMMTEDPSADVNLNLPFSDTETESYNTFMWESPGGATGLSIFVVQISNKLLMFDARAAVVGSNLIETFTLPSSFPRNRLDFARVQGFLVAVNGTTFFDIYSYDNINRTVTRTTNHRLKIRDVFGVEETVRPQYETDVNHRGDLNYQHYYNLFNQGWALPRLPWLFGDNPLMDVVSLSTGGTNIYPSNSDTVWQGMDYRTIGRESLGEPPSEGSPGDQSFIYTTAECFHKKLYDGTAASRVVAAKGFFIIDAFQRGPSRRDEFNIHKSNYPMTGNLVGPDPMILLPTDSTSNGVTCVAEHAGRAFFSGVLDGGVINPDGRTPNYTNFLFFSQLVKNKRDIVKCYQEGDPTSREGSDVVDTDGGFIRVSGAIGIKALRSLGDRLLIFATNGVWAVKGQETGFTATSFTVEKVCNFGCVSTGSIVMDGRSIYYWGTGAIYRLTPNQFGDLEVVDMTTASLKAYYGGVLEQNKIRAMGSMNKYTNVVHWVFNNSNDIAIRGNRITELRYDVSRNAFFPMELSLEPTFIPSLLGSFLSVDRDASGIVPVRPVTGGVEASNTMKYWGVRRNSSGQLVLFFSKYTDPTYADWGGWGVSAVDAPAHILTGDQTGGDLGVGKQMQYLTMLFRNIESVYGASTLLGEGSCLGRVQWEFTDLALAGRWSSLMQLYRKSRVFNVSDTNSHDGHEMVITKTRLRGQGRAFCFYLTTEPLKGLNLIGWNLTATANGVT